MYLVWLRYEGFSEVDFAYGQVVSLCFVLGKLWITIAYADGLAGPVNTLMSCQSPVAVVLDRLVGQQLHIYGITGLILSVVGTFILSVGNSIVRRCFEKKESEELLFSPKPRGY